MEDAVPLGSRTYFICLALLLVGRGADILSTRIATPNLILEANPIAKKLGWRLGIPVNFALCVAFALWPLPAIIISTTSALVAAHNFKNAWLMRAMGEEGFRNFMSDRLADSSRGLFLFCLLGQVALTASVGAALVIVGGANLAVVGIGTGVIAYASAVLVFTLISLWRGSRVRP